MLLKKRKRKNLREKKLELLEIDANDTNMYILLRD